MIGALRNKFSAVWLCISIFYCQPIGFADDCKTAATDPNAKKVVDACEASWDANKSDCNKFLKTVAASIAVNDFTSNMNADAIIAHLEGEPAGWKKLQQGDHMGAHVKAKGGAFVVVGLTSTDMGRDNGHVTVVTAGSMVFSGMDKISYPRGYWGTLGATGKKCSGMNNSFPAPQRKKKLRYYWKSVP